MLITLAGVTGIGKSYFTQKIADELGLKKIAIITTRKRRKSEKDRIDKNFLTNEELEMLIANGEIAYQLSYLGSKYVYLKKDIFSNENSIVELYYNTIYDFKKMIPEMYSIYLMPYDIEKSKQKLIERNLRPEEQEMRLKKIEEEYQAVMKDKNLRSQFDDIFYNNYDLDSERKLIELVKSVITRSIK